MIAALWTLLRRQPLMATVTATTMLGTSGAAGTAGYWVYVQPDPQIVVAEAPIVNRDRDADGVSYNAWLKAGKPPLEWKPVPASTFKAGETMYTLRHDCFLYKTSGPVTRAFLSASPPNGTIYQLPMIYPPTRTNGCKRANFATVIPKDLPPGDWIYQVAVLFYKNPIQPEVRATFPDVGLTVVP